MTLTPIDLQKKGCTHICKSVVSNDKNEEKLEKPHIDFRQKFEEEFNKAVEDATPKWSGIA